MNRTATCTVNTSPSHARLARGMAQHSRALGKAAAARKPASTKDEILSLQVDVHRMERLIIELTRKRDDGVDKPGTWRKLALDQSTEKAVALQENAKLKRALQECKQLTNSLLKAMEAPMPLRRHWNAERIMETMYRQLDGLAINSGLMETPMHDVHYYRSENRELPGETIEVSVSMCQRFDGDYREVADRAWRCLSQEELESDTGASVLVKFAEVLGGHIRHNRSVVGLPDHGQFVRPANSQLYQRIDEDSRVVILWRSVAEDPQDKQLAFTDHTDGWITFEECPASSPHHKRCVMKYNGTGDVVPVDERGDDLLLVLKMMNVHVDRMGGSRKNRVELARRAMADFLVDMIWQNSLHLQRIARATNATHPE